MINIDETYQFGIIWELIDFPDCHYVMGSVFLLIGKNLEIAPRYAETNHTLQVIFGNLQSSFIDKYYPAGTDGGELGDIEVDYEKLSYGEVKNIFSINGTELETQCGEFTGGLSMEIGYSGNEERLFYSIDNGNSYKEIRLPKGTVENVIMSLPSNSELNLLKNKNYKQLGTSIIKVK